MLSLDLRIIDLNRSDWDKKKSKPMENIYAFSEDGKKYIEYSTHRPEHHVTWCRYSPNSNPPLREMNEWRVKWGYQPVLVDDYDYAVDGLTPTADGQFIFGDLILVKTNLINYIEKREAADKMFEAQRKSSALESFKETVPKDMQISDAMIAQWTGKDTE